MAGALTSAPPDPAPPGRRGFDRIARFYRLLETIAFGRALERARFQYVDRLASCGRILVIGEGDGRFLTRSMRVAPQARVTCIDASAAMIELARARLTPDERLRVTFLHGDARSVSLPAGPFDAAVTLFFLDCFTDADVSRIVGRVAPVLAPDAVWLFADFAVPARGWRRFYARLCVGALYAFFRWETGIEARRLPDMEGAIAAAGFQPAAEMTLQAGLLRTVVFGRLPGYPP